MTDTVNAHKAFWAKEYENVELTACCDAPIFWELSDDTDITSERPVCEVCGKLQDLEAVNVLGILETHNFTFYSFGSSVFDVKKLLADRWGLHQTKTGATYTFQELEDSIHFVRVTRGAFEAGEPGVTV